LILTLQRSGERSQSESGRKKESCRCTTSLAGRPRILSHPEVACLKGLTQRKADHHHRFTKSKSKALAGVNAKTAGFESDGACCARRKSTPYHPATEFLDGCKLESKTHQSRLILPAHLPPLQTRRLDKGLSPSISLHTRSRCPLLAKRGIQKPAAGIHAASVYAYTESMLRDAPVS
jgi:hypothetical protein